MADKTIKLAGEHSDLDIEAMAAHLPTSDDCALFSSKAHKVYGISEDMAELFKTSDSIQALEANIAPEIAHKFNNEFQTKARVLLGAKQAELALLFDNEIRYNALQKALFLDLEPNVALQITKDFVQSFKALSKDSTVTQVLKLEVPLKNAFKFDINYKVQAWEKIRTQTRTAEEKAAGITDAISIDSHTKLEALNNGVPSYLAHKFIHPTQIDAWNVIANGEFSLTTEEEVQYALQINTSIKLVALEAGVDLDTAGKFVNQYQTDAWSKRIKSLGGYNAEDALKIDTEIKLNALLAEASPEDAARFTKNIQVEAWKLINSQLKDKKHSAELSLDTNKEIQLEALKANVPPSDAIEVVNTIQIELWKKMTANKENVNTLEVLRLVREAAKLDTIHQGNVLLAGATLATAKVAVGSTHEVAYIKYGIISHELLKKFDAQHKIDLLEAGIDTETASETGWSNAQYLLMQKLGAKKYFGEVGSSLKDAAKSLLKEPAKIRDYITRDTAINSGIVMVSIFGLYTFFKWCCSGHKASPTANNAPGRRGSGLDLTV